MDMDGGLPAARSTQGPAGFSGSLFSAHLNVTLLALDNAGPAATGETGGAFPRRSSSAKRSRKEQEESDGWTAVDQVFTGLMGAAGGGDLAETLSVLPSLDA